MIELKFLYQLPRTEESNGTMVFKVMGSMFIDTVSAPVDTRTTGRIGCRLRNGEEGWIGVSEDFPALEDLGHVLFSTEMSILRDKVPLLLRALMLPTVRALTGDDLVAWAESEERRIIDDLASWYGISTDALRSFIDNPGPLRPVDLFMADIARYAKEEAIGLVHYQKPELEPAKGDNVVVTDDGFVWMVISKDEAYRLFDLEKREIYRLYDDDSDAIIESEDQIDTHEGRFAIEVGKVDDIKRIGKTSPS